MFATRSKRLEILDFDETCPTYERHDGCDEVSEYVIVQFCCNEANNMENRAIFIAIICIV